MVAISANALIDATPSPQPGETVKRTKMITFLLILMFIVLGIGLSAIVLMVYFVITDDPYRDAMAIIKKHIK